MARTLPHTPNIEHLKKEAKHLLRDFKEGDASVCDVFRYLYRFARSSNETILKSEVTLQETQHSLALDYGFKSWKELTAHVDAAKNSPLPSSDDIQWFFERCATGLTGGMPLLRVLRLALQETDNPALEGMLVDIGEHIERGNTFSKALARHPSIFNDTCIAMVRTGEALGTLAELVSQIVALRVSAQSGASNDDAEDALRYANLLLYDMHDKGETSLLLKQSVSLPPMNGTVTRFSHLVNRLKVMAGLHPAQYPEPTIGRISLKIGGVDRGLSMTFSDRADDPSCEILMGEQEDEENVASKAREADRQDDPPESRRILLEIIEGAYKARASDIHFEWVEDQLVVRYRVDGRLQKVDKSVPTEQQHAVVDSLKEMSALPVDERSRPQNGRIGLEVAGRQLDLRVSIMPYVSGESAVVRILDNTNTTLALDRQDLTKANLATITDWKNRPNGMFFISGPTGSGKTTTMYSVLRAIDPKERKIITCEEPVEYIIEGINQQNVDPDNGLPLTKVIREVMQQDPDVIMIGEIRDNESLAASIQMALTGHLVFSSMHTNDAADGVRRLMSIESESYRLNSALIGVMAQRLVRRICPDCREEYEPEAWAKEAFEGIDEIHFFQGKGCDACKGHGYRGRTAVQELLQIDDALKNIVAQNGTVEQIREQAIKSGMVTMKQDGLAKVTQGITTLEEVLRVC